MLELAEELRSVSPLADTWCFFNSSGSESVESAIQLALRYWQLRGKPGKTDLISRWPSFHGSTLGALSLSGSKWRGVLRADPRQASRSPRAERRHPPAPRARRGGRVGRARARGRDRAARRAERRGRRHRAGDRRLRRRDRAAAGLHRRAAPHLRPPRACCSCSTRRSRPSGARASGSRHATGPRRRPDIITFAKGVTSGIVPFSGVLVSGSVAELFEQSPEGFPYGHTFSGYPLGCAVAAEAIRVIRDEDLVAESRRKGALLRARLDALAGAPAAHRRRPRPRAPAGDRARRETARRWRRRRAPPPASSPPAASAG